MNLAKIRVASFLPRALGALALLLGAACGPAHAVDPGSPTVDSGTDVQNGVTNVDLPVPAPEDGWQYNIPAFSVDPGKEVQQCFFFKVPYDVPVFVNHIEIAQTTGTHHMNIFRVKTRVNLDPDVANVVIDGECWKPANWKDWPLVINSQNDGHVDFRLPDGVAHPFQPGEWLMLQTHYVNASTQKTPGTGHVLVNFDRVPESQVWAKLGTAFATNQNIKICPGDVGKTFETTCSFARQPVTIFAANGHFHSRGREFTMSVFDPASKDEGPNFYENLNWAEPIYERGLGVGVPAGGGIRYTCVFDFGDPTNCGDPNNGCCYTFGGMVEFQEHCNAFVYYYPANDTTDVNCF
jgi:hypothetical protein